MQSASQPISIARAGTVRGPEAGNQIWKHYLHLSQLAVGRFRDAYRAAGFGVAAWRSDTKPGKKLGDVPTGRFQFYRVFFLSEEQADLLAEFWEEHALWTGQPLPPPAAPQPE